MGLKEDLKRLKPGDTFPLSGDIRGLGKVTGLKGEPGRPIIIEGPARILSSGVRDVANLRLEESSHVVIRNLTLAEATMDEARAFQAFNCRDLLLEDLETGPNIWLDHVHLTDCEDVTIRRLRCDGRGGRGGRGGQIGSHAVYVAAGCARVTVEDVEARQLQGAPFQVNAEDGAIGPVAFERVRAVGWLSGAGFNILGPVSVSLRDISLVSTGGNGGVRCYQGAKAILERYAIAIESGKVIEGPVTVTAGAPAPPRLDTADPPPPPPDTGGGGEEDGLAAAKARIAELEAIISAAQAELARA